MRDIDFGEITIFNDGISELEILKKLCDERESEEPFHLLNVGDILKKHLLWLQKMPRITPYYAVKCNPDSTVIKVLAALGGNFDCASKQEIEKVIRYGVSGERIIYANPIKFASHIEYAKSVGVSMMTVDTVEELRKIKEIFPEARIIIRIRCDAAVTDAALGEKFGCDPEYEASQLIKDTIELGLELYGFSFHVGSPCGEVLAICRGIEFCKKLIQIAESMGSKHVKIIDIGGGIPGERDFILDEFSDKINEAVDHTDQTLKIISEPGRYYVTSAFTAAARVFGKKSIMREGKKSFMYYVSDGVYGSFIEELLKIKSRPPVALNNLMSECNEKYVSTIWGPTCDSYDCIIKDVLLPEYNIGDWLAWLDVGSYSTCLSSEFNGFQPPKIYPIIKESDWNTLCNKIGERKLKEAKH